MTPVPRALTLRGDEDLAEILEQIRAYGYPAVLVDCTPHRLLAERPQVRRLLAAAASDFGKTVAFHLPETRGRAPAPGHEPRSPAVVRRRTRSGDSLPRSPTVDPDSRGMKYPFVLAVLAGALLTSVVLFVLPRARVTITATAEPLVADLRIILDTSATEPRVGDGVHPARHLLVEDTVEGEFPVETIVEKGERATGMVELINQTRSPQGIKGGSRLVSASGVVVRTERGVIIPGSGRAPVTVRADAGGTNGNLEPQRLTFPALTEQAQRLLSAEAVTALRGGTDRPVRALAQADVDRAAAALRARAETALGEQLRAEHAPSPAGGPPRPPLERPELSRVTVADTESSVPIGTEGTSFRLRARVRAEALAAERDALSGFVRDLLRARAGEGKEVESAGNLDDLRVLTVQWGERRAELSLRVETTVGPALPDPDLKVRLAGRTAENAEAFLRTLPGIRKASVALSPVWIRRVPSNPRNIHLERTPR